MAQALFPTMPDAHRSERADSDLRASSGTRICAWPARFGTYVNMASVKAQTVGLRAWPERLHSGHLTLTYVVCFAVIVVVLIVLAVEVFCVYPHDTQILCFDTYVLQKLCGAVSARGSHRPRHGETENRPESSAPLVLEWVRFRLDISD